MRDLEISAGLLIPFPERCVSCRLPGKSGEER
jgi:hypothetical protein